MASKEITRREFIRNGVLHTAGTAMGLGGLAGCQNQQALVRKTASYHQNMEYRRLGKTNLWVSAVCLGGHWKRVNQYISSNINVYGKNLKVQSSEWNKLCQNRSDILDCCIENGINLVDACTCGEINVYARALKGRRDKMYLSCSWAEKEIRKPEQRTAKKLMQAIDDGLKNSGLEYADIWRITALEKGGRHTDGELEEMIKALDTAKKQGKCRFTGFSSHDRLWIKKIIEKYPDQCDMVLFPYTADSKVLPRHSLFETVTKYDVGVLGIKPFASNSLFKGNSSPAGPYAAQDDRRARMALRYILNNPAITAPIPGLVGVNQVRNAVRAVKERRRLDLIEKAELEQMGKELWARLPDDYQWLKQWHYV